MEVADWGSLPVDLLLLILGRLVHFSDYLRFALVCREWRLVGEQGNDHHHWRNRAKHHILKTCHNKLPLLMLGTEAADQNSNFNGLSSNFPLYNALMRLPFGWRVCGSSLGWILMAEHYTRKRCLLNPFTCREVPLPELRDRASKELETIKKFILSSDVPFLGQFEVVVIYGSLKRLACFAPHDPMQRWKFLPRDEYYNNNEFHDVVYFKGRVYAIAVRNNHDTDSSWDTLLLEVDFNYYYGTDGSTRLVATTVGNVCPDIAYLLVSEEGELLMVQQFLGENFRTCWFKVFVLISSSREEDEAWHEINDLGHRALFVGNNQSVCVSTLEFPNCLPNSIYFTDYRYTVLPPGHAALDVDKVGNEKVDLGVFNLEFRTIQSPIILQPGTADAHPPIWIVPNLKDDNFFFSTKVSCARRHRRKRQKTC